MKTLIPANKTLIGLCVLCSLLSSICLFAKDKSSQNSAVPLNVSPQSSYTPSACPSSAQVPSSSPWNDNGMYDDFAEMHRHMSQMMRRMNQMFYDDFNAGAPGVMRFNNSSPGGNAQTLVFSSYSPSFNVKRTDNEILITCDLPGMTKNDIHVGIKDGYLTISGERKQEEENKNDQKGQYLYRSIQSYGNFSRSFALPDGVDVKKIGAKYENGVLHITIPYQAKPQKDDSYKVNID